MNQSFLRDNQYILEERIRNRMILCSVILVLSFVGAGLLVLLRTPENHTFLLITDIAICLLASWFFIWNLDGFILPYRKLLKMYRQEGMEITGQVEETGERTCRYHGFDCFPVTVAGHKLFVVDNGTISLEIGQQVTLSAVHGIVKEVAL